MPTDTRRRSATRRAAAFTLAEVLVCCVLMVLGFVALVAAFGHDTMVTQRGEEVTLGTFLADEIRDMALQMNFAAVLNLNGVTYSPAVYSTGLAEDLTVWSQHVTVAPVSQADLNKVVAAQGAHAARVTVEVRKLGKPVIKQTYYVMDMNGIPFTDAGG